MAIEKCHRVADSPQQLLSTVRKHHQTEREAEHAAGPCAVGLEQAEHHIPHPREVSDTFSWKSADGRSSTILPTLAEK